MEDYRKIFIDNLSKYMREKEMNQSDLADQLKTNKSVVSSWLTGARYPRMNTMEKIASVFNVEKSDLMEKKAAAVSNTIRSVRIPVLGTVVAGIPMEAIENIIDYEEIPEEMARGKEFFGLRVKGRSMEPKFLEDDIVIVQKTSTVDSGDIAIVLVNGDEATMKKVMRSPEGVTLIAYNPDVYEPHFYSNHDIVTKPVEVIGKVVEIRRKV